MNNKFKLATLALLLVIISTSGFSCKLIPSKSLPEATTKTIELTYWGVWDDSDFLEPIISDFEALHSNISIEYKKFRFAEYEQKLLEAWAEDRGPDIYSIPTSWLGKYKNRITPQPSSIQLAFQESKSTLGKVETQTVVRSVSVLSPGDIKNKFVDVVYDNVILNDQIYGIPYSVDTLALFYNRDLLDASGVATPPSTWTELKEAVKALTKIDQNNNLVQSGIALGTADNVPMAADIVSLLMMQNGTTMINSQGEAAFNQPSSEDRGYIPGLEALRFYTDFADPVKEVYSWNDNQPDALEAFAAGNLAMMFGYSYDLPIIKGRSPKLNVQVSSLPQIQGVSQAVNYANFWMETVSHKSINAEAAWGFLNFAASAAEVSKYLDLAQRPTALRALINQQKDDANLSVFANQTLTAKNWYQGNDALKMEEIFADLINVFSSSAQPQNELNQAAAKINQTFE